MDINFVMAQVFGVLSMAASICSMQFKRRKVILVALLCLNLFAALNMVFLGSWAAAYVSFFAISEMIVNYLLERKKKKVPKVVVGAYIAVNVLLGALSFGGVLDVLPILAAVVFCFTILAKKEQDIRKLMFLNQLLWLVFDVCVGAYALVVSNVLTLVSTAVAYIRYNRINKKRKKNEFRKIKPKSTRK